jgi:hypothetical protein
MVSKLAREVSDHNPLTVSIGWGGVGEEQNTKDSVFF